MLSLKFMGKGLLLTLIFFTLTPVALAVSFFSLFLIGNEKVTTVAGASTNLSFLEKPRTGVQVYASLPTAQSSIGGEAGISDARGEIIKKYLVRYDSPLVNHSYFIVQTADKYQLDYRLITAIAQQESNLGKKMPYGCNNAWGYGIHSAGTLCFDSWELAIETVSQGLRENYLDKGLITPQEIMSKYTPLSNGSWAAGVEAFMAEME